LILAREHNVQKIVVVVGLAVAGKEERMRSMRRGGKGGQGEGGRRSCCRVYIH
jgi:hypothetical protein